MRRLPLVLLVVLVGVLLTLASRPEPSAPAAIAEAREEAPPGLSFEDRYRDGTPDFLRLDAEHDRRVFVRWFTFLAEVQYYRGQDRLPREINDCAALLRFSYREALRRHDSTWASELQFDTLPAEGSIEKFRYPFTPLGANLFRIRGGLFRQADAGDGTFAQFADAGKLRAYNTHFIARDIRNAQPGDLLFYRQIEQNLPFHAMIFLGPSQFGNEGSWIVYHTGPLDGGPGEIRRPSVEQLLAHPSPRWRPTPGNGNFLGIYRWNILRNSD